jgi:hypothetical protein
VTALRDPNFAANGFIVEAQPFLDRALDEPRDLALGSLEHQAIGASASPREYAEPGQKPRARLTLDDEQRVDRARAEHESRFVLADLELEIIDVDHDRIGIAAARRDRDTDP